MKKCPYCGHGNADSEKNCEKCRAELPAKPEQPAKAEKKKDKE